MSKVRIDQVNKERLRLYKFASDDIAYDFNLTLGTVTVKVTSVTETASMLNSLKQNASFKDTFNVILV